MLDEEYEDDERHKGDRNGVDIVMFPPENNEISDGDSDDSDNPSGDIGRLSGRLLQAGGEVKIDKHVTLDNSSDIREALRETDDSATASQSDTSQARSQTEESDEGIEL